ncbi:MAG: hypothetical protein WBA57_22745 [Elainellaceae cyanobacterium]
MSQKLRDSVVHSLMTVAIALGCVVGIGALQQPRLNDIRDQKVTPSLQELEQIENDTRLQLQVLNQIPTLGFDRVIADWVFLQFLQYFGDGPARQQIGYGLSPDYFSVILNHDPYFRDGYLFLSASTTLYTGQPERTIEIFERELPRLSPKVPDKAYYIWRYKAIDELLFLGDPQAAQQSFEMAAEWASTYDDPESQAIARSSQQTAEFLRANPDSIAAQVSAWSMVYYNAVDENTQQLVIRRLEDLGVEVSIGAQGELQIRTPERPSSSNDP